MEDTEFDRALLAAAFDDIAQHGWQRFSVARAAAAAGLALDRARLRFPTRWSVLRQFGRAADAAALAGATAEGGVHDRLLDMVMRRLDLFQAHRAGVVALLRALPFDPCTGLLLARASLASMGWLLEAAGVSSTDPAGQLRRKGLLAVWLCTLRAWQRDDSPDMAATMAALDAALTRAGRAARWLDHRRSGVPPSESPPSEPPSAPPAAAPLPDPAP
jgi:hypothetical protein